MARYWIDTDAGRIPVPHERGAVYAGEYVKNVLYRGRNADDDRALRDAANAWARGEA